MAEAGFLGLINSKNGFVCVQRKTQHFPVNLRYLHTEQMLVVTDSVAAGGSAVPLGSDTICLRRTQSHETALCQLQTQVVPCASDLLRQGAEVPINPFPGLIRAAHRTRAMLTDIDWST